MGLSEVLILVMTIAGFAAGYLAAVLRHGDTKVCTPSASHNSVRSASCANCRKNIDDLRCESGGWNGSGSCTMWAPRNQHP